MENGNVHGEVKNLERSRRRYTSERALLAVRMDQAYFYDMDKCCWYLNQSKGKNRIDPSLGSVRIWFDGDGARRKQIYFAWLQSRYLSHRGRSYSAITEWIVKINI